MANNVYRREYADVAECLAVKAAPVNAKALADTQRAGFGDRQWFGPECNNGADARALYAKGWQDGVRRLSELRADALSQSRSIRRRRIWTDQGDTLDIHRVYSGKLDRAWQKPHRSMRNATRNVSILAPINIACMYKSDQLFWRGAAIAKLADILADAGYNVEIIGLEACSDIARGMDICHAIPLKQLNQPLDLANIAAALAHSGFARSVGFAMIASYEKEIGYGFGMNDPKVVDRIVQGYAAEHPGAHNIVCTYDCFTQDAAQKWLDTQIDAINATMDEAA